MSKKSIYINSMGGTGFQFALSHVIPEMKKVYDEVAVISPYFDIFECNPYVDIVYKPQEIRDFIMDAKAKKARLIVERMYDTESFVYKEISYADAWRKMAGLPVKGNKKGSDTKTVVDPTLKYPNCAKLRDEILTQIKQNGFEDFVICQFWGSQSPLVQVPQGPDGKPDWSQIPYNYDNEPLKRHYPVEKASEFVNLFRQKHPKTAVILYSLPNEPAFEGVFRFTVPYLVYDLLSKESNCKGIVAIDSSLQHLTAGLCKAVVIWAHSLPLSFGYEYNKNIIQDCRRDDILYFSQLGPSGAAVDYIKPEKLVEEVDSYLFNDDLKADDLKVVDNEDKSSSTN